MTEDVPAVQMPQTTLSGKDRQLMGAHRAGQRVVEAMALKRQAESAEGQSAALRNAALAAVPGILERWKLAALGKLKGWPAAAQLKAGENVLALAGHSIEVAPGSAGDRPLAEMSLSELAQHLDAMRENVSNMQAIESTSVLLPNQGSDVQTDAAPGRSPAGPEVVDPHPTPPREGG